MKYLYAVIVLIIMLALLGRNHDTVTFVLTFVLPALVLKYGDRRAPPNR